MQSGCGNFQALYALPVPAGCTHQPEDFPVVLIASSARLCKSGFSRSGDITCDLAFILNLLHLTLLNETVCPSFLIELKG